MAWALVDFSCPHSDCASGLLAPLRELCGATADWGARGRLPRKGLSRPGDGDPSSRSPPPGLGSSQRDSGSEGRMPTDKWIGRASGGIGQRKPRSVVA